MTSLLDAALAYAGCGWHVFPCQPKAKTPATKNGLLDATTDSECIKRWWGTMPSANIGLACGPSGLVVVDKDIHAADGLAAWRELRAQHSIDDETVTQTTPSGGEHLLYRALGAQVRNSTGKLAPGVDVRGDGGYIVVAPSILPNGPYVWAIGYAPDEMEVKPLPTALAHLLIAPPLLSGHLGNTPPGRISKGRQHASLVSLAGTMRRRGMTADEIEAALLVVNAERLEEPAPPENIRRIAESVSKYAPAPNDYALTDTGNAERFAVAWGDTYRYVEQWDWLHYDGQRWARDIAGERFRAAKSVVRMIYHEAGECTDDEQRKAIARWAKASESEVRINAMLALARWELPEALVDDFDQDIYLLNVSNGTIDLRSGEMRPHSLGDLITKLAPVEYDQKATTPLFHQFLDRVMPSAEMQTYLKLWSGYSATGSTREERLSIWVGGGSNGKTTFARIIQHCLGDYARQIDPEILMLQRNEQHPTGKANLFQVRAAFAAETGDGRRLAENTVKTLTSNDRIAARYMRQDFFEFVPTHSLALFTNHKPEIRGTDLGIWRRIDLVPWGVTIEDSEKDADLPMKLEAEAPGILAWIVEGAAEWYALDLPRVAEITAATAQYRAESDVLADFLGERCILSPSMIVPVKALYANYVDWCDSAKERPLGKIQFGSRLKERGIEQSRMNTARIWHGIGLVTT